MKRVLVLEDETKQQKTSINEFLKKEKIDYSEFKNESDAYINSLSLDFVKNFEENMDDELTDNTFSELVEYCKAMISDELESSEGNMYQNFAISAKEDFNFNEESEEM